MRQDLAQRFRRSEGQRNPSAQNLLRVQAQNGGNAGPWHAPHGRRESAPNLIVILAVRGNAGELGTLAPDLARGGDMALANIEQNARSARLCEGSEPAWQHSPQLTDPPVPSATQEIADCR